MHILCLLAKQQLDSELRVINEELKRVRESRNNGGNPASRENEGPVTRHLSLSALQCPEEKVMRSSTRSRPNRVANHRLHNSQRFRPWR